MNTPELWRYLPTAFGALATATMLEAHNYLLAAIAAVLLGVSFLLLPRSQITGLNQNKLPDFELPSLTTSNALLLAAVAIPATLLPIALQPEFLYFHPLVSVGLATPMYALLLRNEFTRPERLHRRRVQKIIAQATIREPTTAQRNVLGGTDTRAILQTLLAVGAVDGVQMQSKQIAARTGIPTERVTTAAKALSSQGLLHMNSLMHPKEPDKWFLEIPTQGLEVLLAAAGPPALKGPAPAQELPPAET